LAKFKRPLLVHAEIQLDSDIHMEKIAHVDARSYTTYLKTRPPSWEQAAIRELHRVVQDTRGGGTAEGAHLHIVHLSDASISLDIIKDAKSSGASLSVETCPHYLAFSAEQIKDGDTRFKCAPPIRDEANRQKLWQELMDEHIDMLSSDHSPTLPQLKLLDEGDFLRAWGGISSLQGAIVGGNYADIVVWDPDKVLELDEHYKHYLKHPNISAYMGTRLSGEVLSTFVKGNLVYNKGKHAPAACGVPILAKR
ncbi:hypothetical protein Taro_014723, partial [Colocasia esculenta]|nr:hypothetical protein [Colocasia esculenta]